MRWIRTTLTRVIENYQIKQKVGKAEGTEGAAGGGGNHHGQLQQQQQQQQQQQPPPPP